MPNAGIAGNRDVHPGNVQFQESYMEALAQTVPTPQQYSKAKGKAKEKHMEKATQIGRERVKVVERTV